VLAADDQKGYDLQGFFSKEQIWTIMLGRRGLLRASHEANTLSAKGSFNLLVQPDHLANRFKDAALPPVLEQ
jgi:hypothetical protein